MVAVSFPDLGPDTGLAIAAMNAVMSVPINGAVKAEAETVEDGRSELQGATVDGAIDATLTRPALNVWQVQLFLRMGWLTGRLCFLMN